MAGWPGLPHPPLDPNGVTLRRDIEGRLPMTGHQARETRTSPPLRQARVTEEQLRDLMLRGLDGDGDAHTALLRAVQRLLTPFFRARMRDRTEVEDLVQEALIAVHERRASFDRTRRFTPWLFAIARYKLVDHFRHSPRHQTVEGLDDILVAEGFEASSNARLDVDRLLRSLPAKQAQAIRMTRICGLSVAEAACSVGIGESDLKVSAHRGLKALAARVGRNGMVPGLS
jgi:RNA polymerase sigma-70 factor (ECF subfamily)